MAEVKSLFQRLQERRAAIESGDPTGASNARNAAAVRAETKPGRAPSAAKPKPKGAAGSGRGNTARGRTSGGALSAEERARREAAARSMK